MNLHDYDIAIINTSGGKDSICAMYEIWRMAKEQNYPMDRIHASHQDLGESEWTGTTQLVKDQCTMFGFHLHIIRRVNQHGREETLLEYTLSRGKWPSSNNRWCTSDFKRGPGSKIVTQLSRSIEVKHKCLYVFGFRKDESPARRKKEKFVINKRLTTKKREVWDYLPIHDWTDKQVWETIRANNLPYHQAYDLGMPRLSCVFCIFSPFDALVIAGTHNPELLDKYIDVEEKTGHTFKADLSLKEVRKAIQDGYKPKEVQNWIM